MERDMDKSSKLTVMSRGAAFLMQNMLYDVLYHGTGAPAAINANFHLNAGGKTGTTSNWKEAWFAGFTKNLVTVVWFGFDDARKSLGRNRTGAVVAAPVWMNYMRDTLKDNPDIPFNPPDEVVEANVCSTSGLLPTEYCPHVITEYFLRNTAPSKKCDIHSTSGSVNDDDKLQVEMLTNSLNIDEQQLSIEPETNGEKPEEPRKDKNQTENFNLKSGIE